MRALYIVRHASPAIHPEAPAREWLLSERGTTEAGVLAATAAGWGLEALYCSSEPKARSTALIIGDAAALTPNVVDAFDELRINDWISNADAFNDLVRDILERAPQLPRTVEPASEAADRFAWGVAIAAQGAFPAAVVSHGRIITAYLTATGRVDAPFDYWRAIPMPGWTKIDLDDPQEPAPPFT